MLKCYCFCRDALLRRSLTLHISFFFFLDFPLCGLLIVQRCPLVSKSVGLFSSLFLLTSSPENTPRKNQADIPILWLKNIKVSKMCLHEKSKWNYLLTCFVHGEILHLNLTGGMKCKMEMCCINKQNLFGYWTIQASVLEVMLVK